MVEPTYDRDGIALHHGESLALMRSMPANSVDLIATDPPYFKVKGEHWDRQWDKPDQFIGWVGELCREWQRILKPNGSLYVFASPQMRARVEVEVGRWFNLLSTVTWVKGEAHCGGWHAQANKESLRSYFPRTEAIIFAEHHGADNIAKGEAGYAAKCDELRGFVFEPLRAYLAGERDRAGFTTRQVAEAFQKRTGSRTVTGMAGHWFERVQWSLPTRNNYHWLRGLFNSACLRPCPKCRTKWQISDGAICMCDCGYCISNDTVAPKYLRREYDDLRREYDDLRREYKDLRRPFTVTADVPYTDVWTFPTVQAYKGKHPCEKPLAMMEHIIRASSRPGGVVLDCFMGSGTTMHAARNLGRRGIGIDFERKWVDAAASRLWPSSDLFTGSEVVQVGAA